MSSETNQEILDRLAAVERERENEKVTRDLEREILMAPPGSLRETLSDGERLQRNRDRSDRVAASVAAESAAREQVQARNARAIKDRANEQRKHRDEAAATDTRHQQEKAQLGEQFREMRDRHFREELEERAEADRVLADLDLAPFVAKARATREAMEAGYRRQQEREHPDDSTRRARWDRGVVSI